MFELENCTKSQESVAVYKSEILFCNKNDCNILCNDLSDLGCIP